MANLGLARYSYINELGSYSYCLEITQKEMKNPEDKMSLYSKPDLGRKRLPYSSVYK